MRPRGQAMRVLDTLVLSLQSKETCPRSIGRRHILSLLHPLVGTVTEQQVEVSGSCGCRWTIQLSSISECKECRDARFCRDEECKACLSKDQRYLVVIHGGGGRALCWACVTGNPGSGAPRSWVERSA